MHFLILMKLFHVSYHSDETFSFLHKNSNIWNNFIKNLIIWNNFIKLTISWNNFINFTNKIDGLHKLVWFAFDLFPINFISFICSTNKTWASVSRKQILITLHFLLKTFFLVQVILATNIAESSVTIPKVAYVIDSCRSLQVYWDANRKTESTEIVWVSESQVISEIWLVNLLIFTILVWISFLHVACYRLSSVGDEQAGLVMVKYIDSSLNHFLAN